MRDSYTCQYCQRRFAESELSIDHLVPLALAGLDEITNYVTACRTCNQLKSATPLPDFLSQLRIPVERLPVHGDPIIDNEHLPIELRVIRRRIFDRIRAGELSATGKQAQKKFEKHFRREFWATATGLKLELEFPSLPGHARIMVPEIQSVANSTGDFLLLLELSKSANTRNLIGTVLTGDADIHDQLLSYRNSIIDTATIKRIDQSFERYEKEMKKRGLNKLEPST